jgi:hypothetical protein
LIKAPTGIRKDNRSGLSAFWAKVFVLGEVRELGHYRSFSLQGWDGEAKVIEARHFLRRQ